ncbi:hypothetical protein MMF93_20740 [Streptomyces tubbatahanensis]|uniref:Uncharacterized protein n=1 Tax=Streptomyces tubbatahanensis TaxID=2923272 RepID=A0ABY3XW99_9ACTN|nr:hypothetical protein [Streptomyces tubbatahanensis]UNS98615.1 hypothetical protein MMF93_20740 [Streptomyces tubbatahanensis]
MNNNPFDELDYFDHAALRLNLTDWLSAAQVFHPRFIEVSGCLIWERAYEEDNFREWYQALNGNATAVESTLNQVRLWQLVDVNEGNSIEEKMVANLAREIAFFWRAALESDHPEYSFDGGVVETEDGPVVRFVVHR